MQPPEKKGGGESDGVEEAAPPEVPPSGDLLAFAGPFRVAARLTLRMPGGLGRLMLLHLVVVVVPLWGLRVSGISLLDRLPVDLVLVLMLLLGIPASWTALVAVLGQLRGEPEVEVGACLATWLARLPTLAWIVVGAGVGALGLTWLGGELLARLPAGLGPGHLVAVLGSALLVDRALALGLLAIPAALQEELGPREALARSWCRAGWPGWALYSATSLVLAGAFLTSPILIVLESSAGIAPFAVGAPAGHLLALVMASLPAAVLVPVAWACLAAGRLQPDAPRWGWTGAGIRLLVLVLMAAIVLPGFHAARRRANQRACFANQKTLSGALELYQLDHGGGWPVYDEAMRRKLTPGYLGAIPGDPGRPAADGQAAYVSVSRDLSESGILCLNHGPIRLRADEGRHLSVREFLARRGATDPELLDRAGTERMDGRSRPGYWGPPGHVLGVGAAVGSPATLPLIRLLAR